MWLHGIDMSEVTSVADILARRAVANADMPAISIIDERCEILEQCTFRELDRLARRIAAALYDSAENARVLLVFPTGIHYAAALLACFHAGKIAVPVYPPFARTHLQRFQQIIEDCQPEVMLTDRATWSRLQAVAGLIQPTQHWIVADELPREHDVRPPRAARTSPIAFLQYTSGSTGTPRGVVLSHANLLANEANICSAFGHDAATMVCGWLPLYHDMGLIGNLLQPLYLGVQTVLMDPATFIRKPLSWLHAISRFGATTSGGPSFAYELCAARLAALEPGGVDLSKWRVAFCGAEPIHPATVARFVQAARPHGFDPDAFFPCYGLAESTLLVAASVRGAGVRKLTPSQRAQHAVADHSHGELVGCGSVFADQSVWIADPHTGDPCRDGVIGEVRVSGPSVCLGYWNAQQDAGVFEVDGSEPPQRSLRTGDLGLMWEGELYIADRLKDLIILNGRNLYPQDIERSAAMVAGETRVHRAACFEVVRADCRAVVLLREADAAIDLPALVEAIRDAVFLEHQLALDEIVLVRANRLPRTTSGKVQRGAAKQQYLAGSLSVLRAGAARRLTADRATTDPLAMDARHHTLRALMAELSGREAAAILPATTPSRLGLDSVRLLMLAGRIEDELGVVLELRWLLENCSFAELCAQLDAAPPLQQRSAPSPVLDRASVHRTTFTPTYRAALTPAQRSLLYLDAAAAPRALFNIGRVLEFPAHVSVARLRECLEQLQVTHQALRTRIELDADGVPLQSWPPSATPFESLDHELDDAALQALREQPFAVHGGPLWRFVCYRAGVQLRALWVLHHLICDFTSLLTLYRDLQRLLAGEAITAAGQSCDLIAAVTRYQASAQAETDLRYWSERLRQLPLTPLLSRPVREQGDFAATEQRIELPDPESPQLGLPALAQQLNVSVYALFVSAVQLALARVLGRSSIALGVAISVRRGRHCAEAVGYGVNPVPLVCSPAPRATLREWLCGTGQAVREAVAHGQAPLGAVLEKSGRASHQRGGESFDAVLSYFGVAEPSLAAAAIDVPMPVSASAPQSTMLLPLAERTSCFALDFRVAVAPGRAFGKLLYRRELVTAAAAAELARQVASNLLRFAAQLDVPLAHFLQPADAASTPTAPARTWPTLDQLFRQQALAAPEAVALVGCDGSSWCYRDLDRYANRVACLLRERRSPSPRRVALLGRFEPALIGWMLGILRAGAAFICINPAQDVQRVQYLLADAGCDVIVDFDTALVLDGSEQLRLQPAQAREELVQQADAVESAHDAGSPAYLVYTSGSTGRPKGMQHAHANLASFLQWQADAFRIGPSARIAQLASEGFDVSYCEILGGLCFGATVCLSTPEERAQPDRLLQWLRRREVQVVQLVASVMRAVLQTLQSARDATPLLAIRAILLVGEKFPSHLLPAVRSYFPNARLYNVYGPSECVAATCYEVPVTHALQPLPLGAAVAGRRLLLLHDSGRACGLHESGEICIGGEFIIEGYLGATETARFHLEPNGDRYYCTGDMGRWTAPGCLELIGRRDNQVKISGVRIELEEVDQLLARVPGIDGACAFVRELPDGAPQLCAALVMATPLRASEVRAWLRRAGTPQMIPSALHRLPSLPRTASGKVDRAALQSLNEQTLWPGTLRSGAADAASHGELEAQLAALALPVLRGLPWDAGVTFFDAGGDSLSAMQLVNRVNAHFGVQIALQALLARPTLAYLAELVGEARAAAADCDPAATLLEQLAALSDGEVTLQLQQAPQAQSRG